jgi:hypothetical protein
VGVYLNDSEDLVTSEEGMTLPYGKDFIITFHVGGPYRIESGDDNFSAYSIITDVHFLSDTDPRDTCTRCAIPNLKPLGDNESDPGYDTYEATFFSDMVAFEGYNGDIQFSIIIKNRTSGIVWDDVFEVTIEPASSGNSGSSGFSIPELPPVIEENLLEIGGGLLVIIILAVGIYTFILAPEDTTSDLYKMKESIDPLSKSLTGVGYESDLPGEEEEDDDDDTEDLLDDDDDEEFDESKLLAELTSPQKLESADEEEEEEPEPPKAKPKKAVKKKVVRKTVSKKVVRKAAPPQDAPRKPPVNMGEGIISITCPSCEKIHNIDEGTIKFICSCGRRIRVN